MTSFRISRGLKTKLPSTKVDGRIYFCTDTGELYIDYKNSSNTLQRVGINAAKLGGATLAQELKNSTSEIPSSALISSIKSTLENSIAGVSSSLSTHTANKSNPHGVTKSQVGLGNVDNTSDANKPVSTAQATAIANAKTEALEASGAVAESLSAHTSNKNNPHEVTLSQLGGQAAITGAATTVTSSNLTASRVLVSNSSGKIAASSSVTTTELGYLDGVTSKIQTQLDSKASSEALLAHIADTNNPHEVTKSTIGLGNVENKSSATIRGELTKANVTSALGYTPPESDTTYGLATDTLDGLMPKEDKIKVDATNIAYGTCATAASTPEKVVTLTGNPSWELAVGSVIVVKFTYTNSAASPTLNVNNTGAKSIWYNTSVYTSSSSYGGYAKRHITYVFDGTYWVFAGWGYDSNSDTKVTQSFTSADGDYPVILAYTTSTTSETANAVKKNLDFVYNPSSSTLTVPNIIGDLDGKATKDGSGNVIVDTYETKNDAINKLNAATAHADQVSEAVNQSLASHTSNSTIHITSTERTNWNAAKTHADSAHAPSDAEKNVQADWSVTDTSSDAYIKNKPTSMTPTSHAHGNITNSGTITSTAVTAATGVLVYDSNNKIQRATAANARSIIGAGTSSLALGTTSSTAYRGDYGNTAYTHSQTTSGNPHNVTKSDLSLGNVENKSSATIRGEITSSNVTTALGFTPISTAVKGVANGLAELDASGKVPTAQLPSYVDDVIEGTYVSSTSFKNASGTAITGETGKIYVDTSTNKTYRWSGSAFVEISASLALGTTSSTAYRGDRGKTAYDHSQAAHAPSNAEKNQNAFSHVTVGSTTVSADTSTDTLTLVAGSNITLTPDATKDEIIIAATDTKYSHPDTHAASMITGLATVATSGSYNDLSNKPTIPTVNNGTLTIQKNGTNVATFTANQSTAATANITVPTKVSELTNDSNFTTASGHTHDDRYYTESEVDTKVSDKVSKSSTAVQTIAGGLVVGKNSTSGVSGTGVGRIMFTGQGNPLIGVQAVDSSGAAKTPWYLQAMANNDSFCIGPTSSKALTFDTNGNMTSPANLTISGTITEGTQTLAEKYSSSSHKHTVSHTPTGTVSAPTITVTPNTTTVNSITAVGTLPSLTYSAVSASNISAWSTGTLPSATLTAGSGSASLSGSVSSGPNRVVTLSLSHTHTASSLSFSAGSLPSLTYSAVDADNITAWSAGTLPTKGSNTTVVTSIKSATATAPTFTGSTSTITFSSPTT